MPISSGFTQDRSAWRSQFPTAHPQTYGRTPLEKDKRGKRKKKKFMSQSYHEQFREHRRNNNQNGLLSKSKATAGNKLPPQRPAATAKQPLRSDTFTLPAIRNRAKLKASKTNQAQNGVHNEPIRNPAPLKRIPAIEQRRPNEDMRGNVGIRPIMKQNNRMIDSGDLERRPVRFANNDNSAYSAHPVSSAPAYYQKLPPRPPPRPPPPSDPLPEDDYDRPRRMRVANDEYVVHRRAESPVYAYNDYSSDVEIERIERRPQRVTRIVHDPPYREFDDPYYVASAPTQVIYEQPRVRRTILQRGPTPPPPLNRYVYVDEPPPRIVRRRPPRSEVVYVEDEPPIQYEDEVVYVDENGNEVQYIYEDEPVYQRRNYGRSYNPPSTKIVYE